MKQKLAMLPSQGMWIQRDPSSSIPQTVGASSWNCVLLNTSPVHLLLSIPQAAQVLMKQTVPRPSHLDPSNLTCPAAPIIFEKIKSKHVFYSYKLFNDFLSLDRNPEVVKSQLFSLAPGDLNDSQSIFSPLSPHSNIKTLFPISAHFMH